MLYDLNVPWPTDQNTDPGAIPKILAVLQTLNYTGVALNVFLNASKDPSQALNTEKFSSSHKCPIPKDRLQQQFPRLKILTRATLIIDDSFQQNMSNLVKQYDIIAVRPLTERSLQNVCISTFDLVDLISLDCTKRMPFFLKHSTAASATQKGIKLEIVYAGATADSGKLTTSESRKHVITNAASLIRASRGRGLIVSSEAWSPYVCRSPYDVINLLCVWGLDHMRAHQAVGRSADLVVKNAYLRKHSHKQVIAVVEKPSEKAENVETVFKDGEKEFERPIKETKESLKNSSKDSSKEPSDNAPPKVGEKRPAGEQAVVTKKNKKIKKKQQN